MLDEVLEIVEHLRPLARQPEAERHGEQTTDEPLGLEDRVEGNATAVLLDGDDVPAISRFSDEGGQPRAGVGERPTALVIRDDRLFDLRKQRQPGRADAAGDRRSSVADRVGVWPRCRLPGPGLRKPRRSSRSTVSTRTEPMRVVRSARLRWTGTLAASPGARTGRRPERRRPDSNWCTRLCRPLPSHSATAPGTGMVARPA